MTYQSIHSDGKALRTFEKRVGEALEDLRSCP
jgi:hypothetical protein